MIARTPVIETAISSNRTLRLWSTHSSFPSSRSLAAIAGLGRCGSITGYYDPLTDALAARRSPWYGREQLRLQVRISSSRPSS